MEGREGIKEAKKDWIGKKKKTLICETPACRAVGVKLEFAGGTFQVSW